MTTCTSVYQHPYGEISSTPTTLVDSTPSADLDRDVKDIEGECVLRLEGDVKQPVYSS
jgi:hypothetical protein